MQDSAEQTKQALLVTVGVLQAVGALWLLLGRGSDYLEAQLDRIGLPHPLAVALGWALPVVAAIALLGVTWRATQKKSKVKDPDRFELNPQARHELKGREQDIRDLLTLIASRQIVLLAGESGSGKSTLISAGLVPDLKNDKRSLPVVVRRYGSDWEIGPLKETLLALRDALTDMGLAIPTAQRANNVDENISLLRSYIEAPAASLGREVILFFDQLDDYQLAHRHHFITSEGAWCSAEELEGKNKFWRQIAESARSGVVRCVLVTRSESAAGLASMRFVSDASLRSRDIFRLKPEVVGSILDSLAPSNVVPPIVTDPEMGWVQLKAVLGEELSSSGSVLPQQIRTVALGLRSLPYLNLPEYRRAGRAAGMEARYVARAAFDCARQCHVEIEHVRAVLRSMVETHGSDSEAKTVTRTTADLSRFIAQGSVLKLVTEELSRSELIRRVFNAEREEDEWQLHHDYLAHAILHEERSRNRHAVALRAAAATWRASAGDWRMRWRALLPLRTQCTFIWTRLRPGSTFRYGPDAVFARWSLLRGTTLALAVALGGIGVWWLGIVSQADAAIDALQQPLTKSRALVDLWSSPASVRQEVAVRLFARPKELKRVAGPWVTAIVGLDTQKTSEIAARLKSLLATHKADSDYQHYLLLVVKDIAPYLASEQGSDMAATIGQLENFDNEYQLDALAALPTSAVKERLLSAKIERFLSSNPVGQEFSLNGASRFQPSYDCQSLVPLVSVIADKDARTLAAGIAERLTNSDPRLYGKFCISLYDKLAARAKKADLEISTFASTLKTIILQRGTEWGNLDVALTALSSLDPEAANMFTLRILTDKRSQFVHDCLGREVQCRKRTDSVTFHDYVHDIQELGSALSSEAALQIATDILSIFSSNLEKGKPGGNYFVVSALSALVPKLNEANADTLLQSLRQCAANTRQCSLLSSESLLSKLDSEETSAFTMLASLATRVSGETASTIFKDLLREDGSAIDWRVLHVFLSLAPQLTDPSRRKLAKVIDVALRLDRADSADRAQYLEILGRLSSALSEHESLLIANRFVNSISGDDGAGSLLPAALSGAMGRMCERVAHFAVHRSVAVECMLLAANFPIYDAGRDQRHYTWGEIKTFAKVTGEIQDILAWAKDKEGINPDAIRPQTLRAHFSIVMGSE